MENKIINFNSEKSSTQIFKSPEFGNVRVILKENDPWFVASDVCKALEIDPTATRRLDEDEKNTLRLTQGTSGNPNVTVVNESGLYNLILGSRKTEAKQFKRWITHEVIPSIRKHGLYAKDELLDNPDLMISILTQLKQEREEKKRLQAENQVLLPKGEYYDQLVDREVNINLRSTAKELCVKEKDLIGYLTAKKYLFRDSKNRLMPYAQYVDKYFVLKEYVNNNHGGVQTLVSVAGREFLLNKIDDIKAFSAA